MDSQPKKNLIRYLNIEQALNDFFNTFNYCYDTCIRLELEMTNGEPVSACCKDRYYKKYDLDDEAFLLLKEERIELYGRPEDYSFDNPVSPCEYHDPRKGCVLPTHKSPICLSFMCQESIEELRQTYSIYEYDYLGMNYALEWILTGDFSDKDYTELYQTILKITGIVSNSERNIINK